MHAPVAPRPPSASTAFGVAGALPPRRRRRGRGVLGVLLVLAVIAGVAGASYALRDSIDDLLDDIGVGEDVDAEDRVAVQTDLGGGVRWTMRSTPTMQARQTPVIGGRSVTMTMWVTSSGAAADVVGVWERQPDFDLDATVQGTAMLYNGQAVDLSSEDIGGHPARTATIDGLDPADRGADGTGRLTLITTESIVVMAFAFGPASADDTIHARHDALVDSLRFD